MTKKHVKNSANVEGFNFLMGWNADVASTELSFMQSLTLVQTVVVGISFVEAEKSWRIFGNTVELARVVAVFKDINSQIVVVARLHINLRYVIN